jgi:hypothetical protein
MVHVSARLAASVVAVSPPYVPVGTVPPLSATRDVTRPPPVPIDVPRVVTPPGAVQAPVTEDLSDQYVTTQLPAAETVAVGEVCDVVFAGSAILVALATGAVRPVPR